MRKQIIFGAILMAGCIAQAAAGVAYNTFVIPSNSVDNVMQNVSSRLHDVGLKSLYDSRFKPHITLYLTQYKRGSLNKIEQTVKEVAANKKPFNITLNGIIDTKSNWLLFNIKPSQHLQRLSDTFAFKLSPLRDKNQEIPGWVHKYPQKISSFRLYGSPNVFTQFTPHITVLPQSNAAKVKAFMARNARAYRNINIKIVGIGIAKVDSNGQAKKIIARYYFNR